MSVGTARASDHRIVTKGRLEGNTQRWRRFGKPVPAGMSTTEDGTPDYGIFGPDSVVWEVVLHPATIVFQYAFQGLLQSTYKPVIAGVREHDPLSRNTRKGTVTIFDLAAAARPVRAALHATDVGPDGVELIESVRATRARVLGQ